MLKVKGLSFEKQDHLCLSTLDLKAYNQCLSTLDFYKIFMAKDKDKDDHLTVNEFR